MDKGDRTPRSELTRRIRRAWAEMPTTRTHVELAREIGVPASTFSGWMNGDGKPSVEQLPALASALGCDPTYFITGEGDAGRYEELDGRLIGLGAELGSRLEVMESLLRRYLDGETIETDPDAVRMLGLALGRRPVDSHPRQAAR